jgi:hypothetical protein
MRQRIVLPELGAVADGGYDCSGRQRSDTGNRHETTAGFMFACSLHDQRVGFINLALQLPQLTLQLCQQHAQRSGQTVLRIFQSARQRSFGMSASLAERDPALQQQPAHLADHRRPATDPAIAHPVQRLHVQLVVALDGHKAHLRSSHGFGDRFGIDVVVLVRLHVGLHVLGRHQANLVALLPQAATEEVGAAARL